MARHVAGAISFAGEVIQLTKGIPYFGPIPVVSGTHVSDLHFVCRSCTLPGGLQLNPASGQLAGLPLATGDFSNVTIVARQKSTGDEISLPSARLVVNEPVVNNNFKGEEVTVSMFVGQTFTWTPPAIFDRDNEDLTYSIEGELPPQWTFNSSSGALTGKPIEAGVYEDLIVFVTNEKTGGYGLLAVFDTIRVLGDDCDTSTNGPNGFGCLHGTCFDPVPDESFACQCDAGWSGPNCDVESGGSASAGLGPLGSGTVAGITVGAVVALALVAALVILYRKNRAYEKTGSVSQVMWRPPPVDEWEFDRTGLRYTGDLGEGNFGVVHSAVALNIRGMPGSTEVAVKKCSSDELDSDQKRRFVAEAQAMKRFDHPNVLRLLGVCLQEPPLLIIAQLISNGDLKEFLRSRHDVQTPRLCRMGLDVAKGLDYLHSVKFIHGDLACRNCLVDENLSVKISDFGLSKDTSYKGYYFRPTSTTTLPLPVRWMSPECLKFGSYTTASDTWSLGVVLWEVTTHCEMPYPAMGNQEVYEKVLKGYRMSKPPLAPTAVYELMLLCWAPKADLRATAKDVVLRLEQVCNQLILEDAAHGGQRVRSRGYTSQDADRSSISSEESVFDTDPSATGADRNPSGQRALPKVDLDAYVTLEAQQAAAGACDESALYASGATLLAVPGPELRQQDSGTSPLLRRSTTEDVSDNEGPGHRTRDPFHQSGILAAGDTRPVPTVSPVVRVVRARAALHVAAPTQLPTIQATDAGETDLAQPSHVIASLPGSAAVAQDDAAHGDINLYVPLEEAQRQAQGEEQLLYV